MSESVGEKEEIEVTPEMIEAGVDELYRHDILEPKRVEMKVAVSEVFRAMLCESLKYRAAM